MKVAALYVDPEGIYARFPNVELWDERRDARGYNGPWPAVAHPPCERWSLMGLCRGYYDGEDGGCFEAALHVVRTFGGVIEHPAHSLAWKVFGLPRPVESGGWTSALGDPGWACFVDQRWYGHPANKPTWLYCCGATNLPDLTWGKAPRTDIRVGRGWGGGSNRQKQRSATPELFARTLLALAAAATDTPPEAAIVPRLAT